MSGKVAIVTGGAMGIGFGIAQRLHDAGAKVLIADLDEKAAHAAAAKLGPERAAAIAVDVSNEGAGEQMVRRCVEKFGRVDVLVNNAGGTFFADFLDVSAKGQQAVIDENFTSVTHFIRGCVPLMPAEGGSIVNVTSIEAHRAAPHVAVYSAMKAAVENLTRSLALEFADRRIRVNCIAVDAVATE